MDGGATPARPMPEDLVPPPMIRRLPRQEVMERDNRPSLTRATEAKQPMTMLLRASGTFASSRRRSLRIPRLRPAGGMCRPVGRPCHPLPVPPRVTWTTADARVFRHIDQREHHWTAAGHQPPKSPCPPLQVSFSVSTSPPGQGAEEEPVGRLLGSGAAPPMNEATTPGRVSSLQGRDLPAGWTVVSRAGGGVNHPAGVWR